MDGVCINFALLVDMDETKELIEFLVTRKYTYIPVWNRTRFRLGIDEYFIHKRDFGISFGRISILQGALTSLFSLLVTS